jgi:hypothetical protein
MRKFVFTLIIAAASFSYASAQSSEMSYAPLQHDMKESKSRLGIKTGYNWSYLTGNS